MVYSLQFGLKYHLLQQKSLQNFQDNIWKAEFYSHRNKEL